MTDRLSDDDLVAGLEDGSLDARSFPHRAHLQVARAYVRRHGPDAAGEQMATVLRGFVTKLGATRVYHETLTRTWVELVAAADAATPGCASVDELVEHHPELLEVSLPTRHYSPALLHSEQARAQWVAPDREPFGRPLPLVPSVVPTATAAGGWDEPLAPDAHVLVAATADGDTAAEIATGFAVVTREPMVVALAIRAGGRLAAMVHRTHGFAVSVLDRDGGAEIAARIADEASWPGPHPLLGVPRVPTGSGHPILESAERWADCRIEGGHTALPHVVLLASVGDRRGGGG